MKEKEKCDLLNGLRQKIADENNMVQLNLKNILLMNYMKK